MSVVIIGGTGNLGFGIGYRLAMAGETVVIGSRQKEKADEAAVRMNEMTGNTNASGMANEDAVKAGDIIFLTVPSSGRIPTLETIKPFMKGKTIVDCTVPLAFKPLRHESPAEGSNAEQTKAILGDDVTVTAGFHTVSAVVLSDPEKEVYGDTIILGETPESRKPVMALAEKIGLHPYDGGLLLHARTLEGLTPLLISMGNRYKKKDLGVTITGMENQ